MFRRPTPVVGATLIVLVVVFVLTAFTERADLPLYAALVLDPAAVLHGQKLWGVLTYALLHSLMDAHHLLFNGLAFYFFGPELEERWGRGRFVLFMLLSALGAAAAVVAATALHLRGPGPVLGFSGVVMGVLVAWGLTFPQREMWFFIFQMKGIHMVYVTLAVEALGALTWDGVASSAHFGGMAVGAGWAFAYGGQMRRYWLERRYKRLQTERDALQRVRRGGGPGLRVIKGGASDDEPPKDKRYLN